MEWLGVGDNGGRHQSDPLGMWRDPRRDQHGVQPAPDPVDALVRNERIVGLHRQRVLDGHEVQRTAFSLEDQVGPVAGAEEVCGARVGFAPGGRVPAGAVQRHGQMKRIGHTTTLPSRAQIAAAAAPSVSGEGIVGRLCGRSGPAHLCRRHCRPCHQTDRIAAGA
ncbi:Uncharacterised protein [Mycobacteroides abscessus subsp. abscessus]|nr:Uncharacterised protein [Mycobacteroides abscessus subsp. abscessus]